MNDPRFAILVASAVALVGAALIVDSPPDQPNPVGPKFGAGDEVYLFQSYNCDACHDFTNFTLPGTIDMILENNRSLIIKNVASPQEFPEAIGHCVWQEFPEHWLQWNRMAFLEKGGNKSTWDTMDQLLYATEYNLLLPLPETSRLEKCIYTQDWTQQIREDTRFAKAIKLPALFSNGKWYEASMESTEAILEAR
ncbi:MAG: DsbA family protein [Thermoplasmatota archaeon]